MFRIFSPLYVFLFVFVLLYEPLHDALILRFAQDALREDSISDFDGAFFMAERLLSLTPENEWEALLGQMSATNIPVQLMQREQLNLSSEAWAVLARGEIWVSDLEDDILLKQLPSRALYVQFGPVATVQSLSERVWASIFSSGGFLVLVVVLWTLTVQRRVGHLAAVAKAFGEGQWRVRASERASRRVGQLNRSFNQMAEQIQQLMDSHRALTNAVSHELKTPIARIQFELELASQCQETSDLQASLESISEDAQELEALVSELLIYAKFERDQMALHYAHQSVRHWLQAWQVEYRSASKAKKLEVRLPSAHMRSDFDADAMHRALDNLVHNAQRYARDAIFVHAQCEAGQMALVVEDDGPGIAPEHREALLKPFVRLDKSRSRKTGGVGLGLAVAHQIAQRHNGNVKITESSFGGARIAICWPQRL